ncbi:MAG: hypothetical protein RLP09_32405 [Sandaracinaceae bacterium]
MNTITIELDRREAPDAHAYFRGRRQGLDIEIGLIEDALAGAAPAQAADLHGGRAKRSEEAK